MKSRAFLASILGAVVFTGFVVETQNTASAIAPAGPAKLASTTAAGGRVESDGSLLPRKMVRKKDSRSFYLPINPANGEPWYTGNIVLKFHDWVGARATMTDSPAPISMTGVNIASFSQILGDNKLTVRQWINQTPGTLANLEERARVNSGRAQPDLAGMMIIQDVNPRELVRIARAINDLPEIEFVDIERIAQLDQCGPDAVATCNVPSPNCADPAGFNCNPDPGNQNNAAEYGCKDANCCTLIATQIPYCNNEDSPNGWDVICAAYANLLCDGTIYDAENPSLQPPDRYDPCFTDPANPPAINPVFEPYVGGLQAGCFEPHVGRGCAAPACCYAVCTFDSLCCSEEWDQSCVNLALSPNLANSCASTPVNGPTPDFTYFAEPFTATPPVVSNPLAVAGAQLYTQAGRVNPENPGGFPGAQLFGGEGLDIAGFTALQQEVSTAYQGGAAPLPNGKSIRVAIIEFSAFVNHEEFTKDANGNLLAQPRVIQEPGQTILLIEGANNAPQHGTATLGEVVSGDNGFGVTGIASEAQGYFFPIVSIEEGSRAQNAITNCMLKFRAGDVVNHSWGSPPDFPLPSIGQYYVLIAMGTDLGITTCCSAGNSDCPIQPQAGEVDCGAIVVGAAHSGRKVLPIQGGIGLCPGYNACGARYIRAPFSNYTGDDDLTTVHVMAWGENVCTTGYGDLFLGENGIPANDSDPAQLNQLRTYSGRFNGTSSASPIIAGSVALVQAFAKQVYGTPLGPIDARSVLTGQAEAQCDRAGSPEQCGSSASDCCVLVPPDPDCDGIFKAIGGFPKMRDAGVAVFTGTGWDGNQTNIRVVAGTQPEGYPWAPYLIRAVDLQAFRINTVRGRAGAKVEGLSYVATGNITDVDCLLDPPIESPAQNLSDISLRYTAKASRNFVLINAFIKNFQTGRYEYFGARFLTTLYPLAPQGFALPAQGGYTAYLNPANNNIDVRLWTVGLGATGSHQISYDMIQIGVNDPLNPL